MKQIQITLYQTAAGSEPVREWLKSLDVANRNAVGQDLMRVQFGWPVGMPLCRPLAAGLWEVRSHVARQSRGARVVLFHEGRLAIVNGFIKKTQKTPQAELDLARKRMKEMKS